MSDTPPAAVSEPAAAAPTGPRTRPGWVRALRIAAVVIVVLAVLFHVAGGWYFAGQIYSGALRIDPGTVHRDLRVERVATGTISLHEVSGHDDTLRSALLYGLDWAGGYGQVSGAPVDRGDVVSRHFTLLSGTLPAAGTAAGLARDAFPDDPAVALGRPVQDVTYRSPLGATPAWFVPGRSATWAVLVHGWTA